GFGGGGFGAGSSNAGFGAGSNVSTFGGASSTGPATASGPQFSFTQGSNVSTSGGGGSFQFGGGGGSGSFTPGSRVVSGSGAPSTPFNFGSNTSQQGTPGGPFQFTGGVAQQSNSGGMSMGRVTGGSNVSTSSQGRRIARPRTRPTSNPSKIIVHPLVLLSVVDHYNRVAELTKKRVVGVLLGQNDGEVVNVANSFAVPFEEDEKNPSVWFLDHNYVETMRDMFKKINAKEKVIGWYHNGPKLRSSDLQINELFKRFTPNPVLVVVDVQPKEIGLPTDAYFAVEEIHDDGTSATKTFEHVPSEIGAEEAEEIGVEHLLRDIKDNSTGTLATRISHQFTSLRGLSDRLADIRAYLQKVLDGNLPVNSEIIQNLQDIFNLLPNLTIPDDASAFTVQTNDQYALIYVSAMARTIIALHDLINNKIENREAERKADEKENETKAAAAAAASTEAASSPTKAQAEEADKSSK
ncbi:proteasome regulatory particle subunit, partial [Coemansia sp. RSA 2599]